eukprot:3936502-Rhodomonas_salina.1
MWGREERGELLVVAGQVDATRKSLSGSIDSVFGSESGVWPSNVRLVTEDVIAKAFKSHAKALLECIKACKRQQGQIVPWWMQGGQPPTNKAWWCSNEKQFDSELNRNASPLEIELGRRPIVMAPLVSGHKASGKLPLQAYKQIMGVPNIDTLQKKIAFISTAPQAVLDHTKHENVELSIYSNNNNKKALLHVYVVLGNVLQRLRDKPHTQAWLLMSIAETQEKENGSIMGLLNKVVRADQDNNNQWTELPEEKTLKEKCNEKGKKGKQKQGSCAEVSAEEAGEGSKGQRGEAGGPKKKREEQAKDKKKAEKKAREDAERKEKIAEDREQKKKDRELARQLEEHEKKRRRTQQLQNVRPSPPETRGTQEADSELRP